MKNQTITRTMRASVQPTPIGSDFLPVPQDVRRIPEFIEFAKWSATPRFEREVETQKELAEQIGVSQDTLTDWKKRPEFMQLVGVFLREWMHERMPDVIGGLFGKIESGQGSASDVRVFLALAQGTLPPLK